MSTKLNEDEINVGKPQRILYFLFFFSFLLSMNLWLGWEGRAKPLNYGIGILSFLLIYTNKIRMQYTLQNLSMFFILVVARYLFAASAWGPGIIFEFLPYLMIICLNDIDKERCLKYIVKCFAYLMIPCLIVYLLHFFVSLPSFGIQIANDNDWAIDKGYGVCRNFILYMESDYYGGDRYRFNGPFLEPGHVGMICAFLLTVTKFDFSKRTTWILLITLVFSLSLAGFALFFIGFMLISYYQKLIKMRRLVIYMTFFLVIYFFGMYYNGGQNIVNEEIISRLEPDDEKGFAGNNRVFGLISFYYAAMWLDQHTLLWGYPPETMEWLADNGSRGTGYIMWMCQHGLIGTTIVALMYTIYAIKSKAKMFALFCLVFVAAMFWQRSYPFWTSWLICFVYGIVSEERRLINK